MKAMILVLSPEECAKLMNGDLSVLVRKKFPEDYVGWVYIYCTKDKKYANLINRGGYLTGMVVARFWCDKVEEIIFGTTLYNDLGFYTCYLHDFELYKQSCLTKREMQNYLKVKPNGLSGYAIRITNLEIFDKPKELWRFKTPKMAERYKLDLKQAREDDCEIGERIAEGIANDDECANCVELTEMSEYYYGLQRMPPNYCYVEVENENSKRI